jgi:hypothetical protein
MPQCVIWEGTESELQPGRGGVLILTNLSQESCITSSCGDVNFGNISALAVSRQPTGCTDILAESVRASTCGASLSQLQRAFRTSCASGFLGVRVSSFYVLVQLF